MKILYIALQLRYKEMSSRLVNGRKINDMMEQVVQNCEIWPPDKSGRWVGYVQCLLIEVEKVTTVDIEREYTRPLFHAYYKSLGIEIPESIDIERIAKELSK